MKDTAAEQLLKQDLSNDDLSELIMHRAKAAEAVSLLRERFGAQSVDEKEISTIVLSQPGRLEMSDWHCGTSHFLAGWATVLSPIAREIEGKEDTRGAGCAVIPSLAPLLFSDNDIVLAKLRELANG
ncbi:hypothetical protein [Chitinophaga tropicalis]|uniref:Uncharacterized protein n=1 Tax=Chitinophaga tropicalis TaxID=2683588 RepID=A0A7K1U4C9_9BACT|nr:hypothetical protein [Chitinophaga tropicalis]MVT09211.1 hypothetical protein [Chitinophaga tropicalis]